MTRLRVTALLATTVLTGAVVASGCGVGPGEAAEGEANLSVTRDFGVTGLVDATLEDPTPSDSVVRFLDENAEVETSYGGNFVDSIDGLAGSTVDGGAEDWFFFVNGSYSDIGAGEAVVQPGDRIWWDFRRWSEAYRVPAVVGSWPEPFVHGTGDKPPDVVVECLTGRLPDVCEDVVARLEAEGVTTELETVDQPLPHPDSLRVLVGAWEDVRSDPAAAQLERGPSASGVYAEVASCGLAYRLDVLGSDARPRERLTEAGFVAAVRDADDQPTWLVSATEEDSLPDAVELLEAETLRDRYAVATGEDGEPLAMPAPDDRPVDSGALCP